MTFLVGASAHGSPGVSTALQLVAAQWPARDLVPVVVEGQFDKRQLDPQFVKERETLVTRGWRRLKELSGLDLPIKPVRGQMILYGAPPGLLKHIVLYQDHYLIPRIDGHILAGSTLEDCGYDNSITPEARKLLAGRALRLVPALVDCEVVRQWAGLRPGSPDGVPFIGEHPAIRGLFVNTGHYRNGVVMGPASARLLSDRMLEQASFTDYMPYVIDRS